MQISAEIRWFWRDTIPKDVQQWFCRSDAHRFPSGGGHPRTDEYLRDPEQVELGIKRRDDAADVEIKGLVTVLPGTLVFGQLRGSMEIWSKWSSNSVRLDTSSVIAVRKQRWLRKFDTGSPVPTEIALDADEGPIEKETLPQEGCNIELTELHLPRGTDWWTLGFEAFGAFDRVRHNLSSATQIINTRQPPTPRNAILASYPKWLAEYSGLMDFKLL